VKAYVGGPNYVYFQYDMAMVGRRQVGSTIKPYLYTLAMENGFSPCDQARHVEQTLIDENGTPWTPRNANDKRYGEMVTLKWGLANSDNWISAYLMGKLNPYDLVRLIHSFGVRNKAIDPVVSLCLGPCEISVGEMVSAYTAFANKGIRAAGHEIAVPLYEYFCNELSIALGKEVETGEFGADMKVELLNNGPVTICMDTKNKE
jgi:penicillin-binding protein 1A